MSIAAARESWKGQLIGGKFPLLQWLGSSEHSAVFLTELRGQEPQKAVIKLISADAGSAETQISRWQVTAGLSHPHLLRLFDMGKCEIDSTPLLYVVLEYAEADLSQVLPVRPLTPAEAGEMLAPVVDVLSYLHGEGLVHGHLKPSNMMVVDDQLKLSCDSIHAPGESCGNGLEPSMYDAPEATTGTATPTATADVWSLGVTLVSALTQHLPTFKELGQGEPILPQSIPDPFHDIARECLRRDPEDRCTLEYILTRIQSTAAPLKIIAGTATTSRRLMRTIIAPVAVVLLVLLVFAGLRLITRRTQNQPTLITRKAEQAAASSAPPLASNRGAEYSVKTRRGVFQGAVVQRVLPDVPQNARDTIRGTVRVKVRVTVSPAGDVLAATSNSRGRSRVFSDLALQAARGWKFRPPQIDGQSVASEWILRFQIRKTETQVVPSLRHVAAR